MVVVPRPLAIQVTRRSSHVMGGVHSTVPDPFPGKMFFRQISEELFPGKNVPVFGPEYGSGQFSKVLAPRLRA